METIKGSITGKESKDGVGQRGAWKRTTFEINATKYATFEEELASQFNVGDYVQVEVEKNGNYNNIKHMTKTEASPETQPTGS